MASPGDANHDNDFQALITVTDGYSTINRSIVVRVLEDDDDDDNDGALDVDDKFPMDAGESMDTDGDGMGNNADEDDDNDGIADVDDFFPLYATNNYFPVWIQSPSEPVKHLISSDIDSINAILSEDLDEDEALDILSISRVDNGVLWQKNSGERVPAFNAIPLTEEAGAYAAALGALDSDNAVDVVIAYLANNKIAWYKNKTGSSEGFTEYTIDMEIVEPLSVAVAQINADPYLDIIAASGADNTIFWYDNDGGETPEFSRRIISDSAVGVTYLTAQDIDGDGDSDVLAAITSEDTSKNNMVWYENQGGAIPGFVAHTVDANLFGVTSLAMGDIDGDGKQDLLATTKNDDTVAWYRNTGSDPLVFTKNVISRTADGAAHVLAEDIDGDGDIDVLMASTKDSTVAWYENDGSEHPVFRERVVTTTASYAYRAITGDVDNNGNIDIITSSNGDDTVAWYSLNDSYYSIAQGETLVVDESATDADGQTLVYGIIERVNHPQDARYFSIDSNTGELTFSGAPVISNPDDSNGDNIYEVWISVTDGYSTLNRAIAVEVTE